MSRFKFLEFSNPPAEADPAPATEEFTADYFFRLAEEQFKEGFFEAALLVSSPEDATQPER